MNWLALVSISRPPWRSPSARSARRWPKGAPWPPPWTPSPASRKSANTISRTLFVGLAMIETMAIYCLVIALLLLFANPLLK